MLEITVEGIYESDIGSGQKKYKDFKYTFKTSRLTEKGVGTHVMRRFLPLLIAGDKTKSGTIFSRMKSFLITDIKKVDDTKDCIIDKDIMTFSAWQIQDLACTFDLFKVPLPNSCSITEMRELAVLAYMEKVLQIPMKSTKDKEDVKLLEKQQDGSFKLNLGDEKIYANIPPGFFKTKVSGETKEKKSLSYFLQKAGIAVANGILNVTGNTNETIPKTQPTEKNPFPSENELLNQINN